MTKLTLNFVGFLAVLALLTKPQGWRVACEAVVAVPCQAGMVEERPRGKPGGRRARGQDGRQA